eukprot:1933651-Rhodomonas_salina.4
MIAYLLFLVAPYAQSVPGIAYQAPRDIAKPYAVSVPGSQYQNSSPENLAHSLRAWPSSSMRRSVPDIA